VFHVSILDLNSAFILGVDKALMIPPAITGVVNITFVKAKALKAATSMLAKRGSPFIAFWPTCVTTVSPATSNPTSFTYSGKPFILLLAQAPIPCSSFSAPTVPAHLPFNVLKIFQLGSIPPTSSKALKPVIIKFMSSKSYSLPPFNISLYLSAAYIPPVVLDPIAIPMYGFPVKKPAPIENPI